jgi:hypothetical protein
MDTDGRMYLWSTGEVRPVSAFEINGPFIKDGHYVIQWKDHAITVHCGNTLVDGKLRVSVQFMCNRGTVLSMPAMRSRQCFSARLCGIRKWRQTLRKLKELHEAVTARHQAPHRRRMRMS